jgi:polar amino acid transport system substrate-binding protein
MSSRARRTLFAWPLACALLASCAIPPASVVPPEVRAALAPTGTLRVGVYPGSPTSMVRGPGADEMRGVSVDIGRELARRLGVRAEIVVFERAAEVVQAVKAGRADVTITNATPARAKDLDFTTPLVGLELGYLVVLGSTVTSVDTVDRPGVRIGVSQGSSSQAALSRIFRHAVVVPAPSLKAAADLLKTHQVDAFATNKAILFEMADALPGAQVLQGRWGLEHLAIAVTKGRDAGMPYLQRFADEMRDSGAVRRAAQRAGLRGTASPDAH